MRRSRSWFENAKEQRLLLICREPLVTRDPTLPKNLRYEIRSDLSLVAVRYAHKIISTNHEVMIGACKRSFKSNFF